MTIRCGVNDFQSMALIQFFIVNIFTKIFSGFFGWGIAMRLGLLLLHLFGQTL